MQKQKLIGTIKSFSGIYGFIERDDFGDDAFIHKRELPIGLTLAAGDRIEFELAPSPKHPDKQCAINIELIERRIRRY
jgi:cold shock CspA family protein